MLLQEVFLEPGVGCLLVRLRYSEDDLLSEGGDGVVEAAPFFKNQNDGSTCTNHPAALSAQNGGSGIWRLMIGRPICCAAACSVVGVTSIETQE
jgi:hypothetical protein